MKGASTLFIPMKVNTKKTTIKQLEIVNLNLDEKEFLLATKRYRMRTLITKATTPPILLGIERRIA